MQFRSTTSAVVLNQTLVDLDGSGLEVNLASFDDLETRCHITRHTFQRFDRRGGRQWYAHDTEGNDNDNVAVRANGTGDILLRAVGASSDIIVTDDLGPGGAARIVSGTGNIVLSADDDIDLNAQVQTGGAGTIDLVAKNLTVADPIAGIFVNGRVDSASGTIQITAGQPTNVGHILLNSTVHNTAQIVLKAQGSIEEATSAARIEGQRLTIAASTYAHLHDVNVTVLTADVGSSALLKSWQIVNAAAGAAGQMFFNRFNGLDDGSTFDPSRVLTGEPPSQALPPAIQPHATTSPTFTMVSTRSSSATRVT